MDLREIKQIIYHLKGIDKSYPKNMHFIIFEPPCQKLWAFLSNFGSFYDSRSPNMVMSRERRCKFQNFLLFAISKFNISTGHKISSGKDLYFRSYLQKHQGGGGGGVENTPSAFGVNILQCICKVGHLF